MVTGTIFVSQPVVVDFNLRREPTEKAEAKLADISTFEDIDIYAKQHGCTFVFVGSWANKKVYSTQEFVNRQTQDKEKWKERAVGITKDTKNLCKEGKTFAYAFNGHTRFNLKTNAS